MSATADAPFSPSIERFWSKWVAFDAFDRPLYATKVRIRDFSHVVEERNAHTTQQNCEKPRESADREDSSREITENRENTVTQSEKPGKQEKLEKPEKLDSSEKLGKLEVRELYSCGNASKNAGIRIVIARESSICGEDQVGEIHVQSASVARGYYPDTRSCFTVKLQGATGEWLSTGDLGFLHVGFDCLLATQNGELYVCGRAKDLLIVRGRNYYPQDIEQSCCTLPEVKPGAVAAIAVPQHGQESLVVVLELRDGVPNVETVVTQVRQAIAEENGLVPSEIVVIRPKTIAKTTSGKISRHRVLEEYLNGTLQVLYRQQFVEVPADSLATPSVDSAANSVENPTLNASNSIQSTLPSQLDGINTVFLFFLLLSSSLYTENSCAPHYSKISALCVERSRIWWHRATLWK